MNNRATNDIPRIAEAHVSGEGYHLTSSQIMRRRRGQSIWKRDEKIAEYEVDKGKWA